MSGLGSFSTGGNATYLRIGMGKDEKDRPRAIIGKRAKEGDPGAVQVFKADGNAAVDKDGNAVYRTEHAFIEGMVRKIERAQPEYNGKAVDVLNITFDAGLGALYILQLEKGDPYWGDIAQRMPNIDWEKPVKLQPYSIVRDDDPDKRNRILMAYQGGEKVPKAWNKDSDPATAPPQPVYDEDEKKWMWGKRNNWLDANSVQKAIDIVTFNAEHPVSEEAPTAEAPVTKTAMDAAVETAKAIAEKNKGVPLPQVEDNDDGLPPLSF